jgi:hypothetical protein
MSGEYALLKILLADASVAAVVGTRVYLDEAPQTDPYPLIIIEEENNQPGDSKSGVSATDEEIVRIYPYAEDPAVLKTLAKACRAALDGNSGTYNNIKVEYIRFTNQSSFYDKIENRKIYAKDQEYTVRVIL